MNIIFIDDKILSNKSKLICYLYEKYGFWVKKCKNKRIYTLLINENKVNVKILKKVLSFILRKDINYVVLSKSIDQNKSILSFFKEHENITIVTQQNNLLKNDLIYINKYINDKQIMKEQVRVLFVIDSINDIIVSKLYYFIQNYKIVDILLLDTQNYSKIKKFVDKINNEEGTVIEIIDKIKQKNYNIILVFSKKQKFFYDCSNSYILDYNNSDLDICSNTYLIFEKNKQRFIELFKLIGMDISRFEKTKLGKLYIHTNGFILDK